MKTGMIRDMGNMRTVAFLALGVFVAWAAIDSIPKIARISTEHRAPAAATNSYDETLAYEKERDCRETRKQDLKDMQAIMPSFREVNAPWWGRPC